MTSWLRGLGLCFALLWGQAAWAHVGTSTVFVQGKAGAYPVYVTVTPPAVIPGEAVVSVVCGGPGVRSVAVQANVLGGASGHSMPEAWKLTAGPAGSHEFHGTAWIMTQGSWQVRVTVEGDAGVAVLAVPLAASPVRLMRVSKGFGAYLIGLGLFLVVGLVAVVGAAAGQAQDDPGIAPGVGSRRRGRWAAVGAVAGVVLLLVFGADLWRQQVRRDSRNIYVPLAMSAAMRDGVLRLELKAPEAGRRMDDLVTDHGHLMHLYVVRWPEMDAVYHLHPRQVGAGVFEQRMPGMEAGNYRLFADVVHGDGYPETAVGSMDFGAMEGSALVGDDTRGTLPVMGSGVANVGLADGYRILFAMEGVGGKEVKANVPVMLRFTLLDPGGKAPRDMQNYMGMLGHAAVIKDDGTVFAHIHPNGSAAMAATMMANGDSMAGMDMSEGPLGNVAAFPFGFPGAGRYRLIVQMKHGGVVEAGAVDVDVR